jgi:shikimate dehydrogenase
VASLAKAGVAELALFDAYPASMNSLAERLRTYYPGLKISVGSMDPAGFDIVVNATPLGMKEGDPLPMDVSRISPSSFVGEVVMKQEITPFLAAARARGCAIQIGTDMLFEQIPAYLEFFGFRTTTPDELRTIAQISY